MHRNELFSKLTHVENATDHDLFLWSLYTTRVCVCVVLLFLFRSNRACRLKRQIFTPCTDHVWIFAEVMLCAAPLSERPPLQSMALAILNFVPVPLFVMAAEQGERGMCACCVLFALLQRSAMAVVVGGAYAPLFLLACRPLWVGAAVYAEGVEHDRKHRKKKDRMFVV